MERILQTILSTHMLMLYDIICDDFSVKANCQICVCSHSKKIFHVVASVMIGISSMSP
jgi:hypothetical protein